MHASGTIVTNATSAKRRMIMIHMPLDTKVYYYVFYVEFYADGCLARFYDCVAICTVDWLVRLRSLHTLYLQKEFAE